MCPSEFTRGHIEKCMAQHYNIADLTRYADVTELLIRQTEDWS